MAHLIWEWNLSHARLRDLLMTGSKSLLSGSAANLSVDLAAGPISPTVDSHYHHFMLACPCGDLTTTQNETNTPLSTLSSPLTLKIRRWTWVSFQSPFHGLRATHIWVDASPSIFINNFHKTVEKSTGFKSFPMFSRNDLATNLKKEPLLIRKCYNFFFGEAA